MSNETTTTTTGNGNDNGSGQSNEREIGSIQEIWTEGYSTPWLRIHTCRTGKPKYAVFFPQGEREINGELVSLDAMFATSVAINQADGSTRWIDIRAYRQLAELMNQHIKQGNQVVRFETLEGYSRQGKPYEDKAGRTVTPIFVVVKKFAGVSMQPYAGESTDADQLDNLDFDPFTGEKIETPAQVEAANRQQNPVDEKPVTPPHQREQESGVEDDIPF